MNLITLKLLKEISKVKKENISKLMVSFSDSFRLEIIDLMMDGEVCVYLVVMCAISTRERPHTQSSRDQAETF